MAVRKVYHVVKKNECWQVKKEGSNRPAYRSDNKQEAVQRGRQLAKRAELGQIIIHKRDGKIQTEFTYGRDPRGSRG